jgi:hypothetical protein
VSLYRQRGVVREGSSTGDGPAVESRQWAARNLEGGGCGITDILSGLLLEALRKSTRAPSQENQCSRFAFLMPSVRIAAKVAIIVTRVFVLFSSVTPGKFWDSADRYNLIFSRRCLRRALSHGTCRPTLRQEK